jgi:chromosome segregation ATPase
MSRTTTQQLQTNIEQLNQKILADHDRSSKLTPIIAVDKIAANGLEEEIKGLQAKFQGLQAKFQGLQATIKKNEQDLDNANQRRTDNERERSILDAEIERRSRRQHRQTPSAENASAIRITAAFMRRTADTLDRFASRNSAR